MNRKGNGDLEFTRISLIDDISNTEISDIQCGTDVRFRLYFDLKSSDYKNIVLAIGINNEYDERITFLSNEMINKNIELSDSKSGFFDILVYKMPLTEGRYNLTLFCSVNGIIADWIQHAYYFNIVGGDFYNTGKNVPDGNGNILLNYSI
jgi:lipopolysaccharide transport system ATP-binding protein